jgi:hypothetical protein
MTTIGVIIIIAMTTAIIIIGNSGFIAIDVVTNAIDFHVVSEGRGGCANESERQQNGA